MPLQNGGLCYYQLKADDDADGEDDDDGKNIILQKKNNKKIRSRDEIKLCHCKTEDYVISVELSDHDDNEENNDDNDNIMIFYHIDDTE